ncbi:EamA family transporter [Pseudomonas sp. PA15(2017)]|uniref:DMT family transporter n=1 Tax=Pseudomonas sp. PA15(2017) TaxID=1932111 RepID=UPI000959EEE5|nr:DMT family transporter [Pseudomonas sp. PA15(2017)]OLU25867.1 EamA family transporter [Pseudomonas sp. PA15(2017)]
MSARLTPCLWPVAIPLLLLEAALVVIWSSGFIGARFSIEHAPAMLVVFWRSLLFALLLAPWALPRLRNASPATLLRHAGIGLLAMGGYLAGVVQGIALGVPAGLAALLADLLPIGVALLSVLVFQQHLGWRTWLGLTVGLTGVVLVTSDALAWGDAPLWVYGLPLLGMFSLAVATLWQKRTKATASLDLLGNLWLQCCICCVPFALLAAMDGSLMPVPSSGFALSVLWTSVSTIGGYGLYWLCLKRSTPTRVASVLYLSPALTLVWASAMFGEPLSWLMGLGTLISGLGIWLVIRNEPKRRDDGPALANPSSATVRAACRG